MDQAHSPNVRILSSARVHRVRTLGSYDPMCGAYAGRVVRRLPSEEPVTCPVCKSLMRGPTNRKVD